MDRIVKCLQIVLKIGARASVLLIKTISFICSLSLLLLIILVVGAYYAEKKLAGGYYSGYIMELLVMDGLDSFLRFSFFSDSWPLLSTLIITVFFAALFLTKLALRESLTKGKHRDRLITNVIYLVTNIALNVIVFILAATVIFNSMITNYISHALVPEELETVRNAERAEYLRSRVKENHNLAAMALWKIIYDIENNADYIDDMTEREHLELCEEVNFLFDIRGGPGSADEHYLRNKLNNAPATLDDLLEASKNPDTAWVLLPPSDAAFHMFGEDGEYNLKFVSGKGIIDGALEAVYDVHGGLVTEQLDPINMGTYNYASPLTNRKKHSTFDVLPYFGWGNTPNTAYMFLGDGEKNTMEEVFENLDRFQNNRDAVARYNYYKKLLESYDASASYDAS